MHEVSIVLAIGITTALVVLFVAAPILYFYDRWRHREGDSEAGTSFVLNGSMFLHGIASPARRIWGPFAVIGLGVVIFAMVSPASLAAWTVTVADHIVWFLPAFLRR